ncbi:MAG: nucleoside hydrolase [Rhizobiales bacterium]|nr:nucleoside hydrolase [Hyphomicrobiales bacterium]
MPAEKVIIDTDPGIDDAMAILFAIVHDDIDLIGLTTIFGNVTTDIATRNALALTELSGVDVPVARGAYVPLVQEALPVADFVHGKEGFGEVPPFAPSGSPVEQTAADFICATVNANPGEIILCPVGPLTNLAIALEQDPSIATKVKSVTVMGGSVAAGGNATPFAEANIWQDPHAARAVFEASWDVTLVGLDVTHKVICGPADFAGLADAAPKLGGFLNDAAQFYFRFHEKHDGFYGCHMHDPTAVISIARPDLFTLEHGPLDVIVEGDKAGQTIKSSDTFRPRANLCMGVDDNAVREVFLSTIKSSF